MLIDREQGGRAFLESKGLNLYSGFTLSFILEVPCSRRSSGVFYLQLCIFSIRLTRSAEPSLCSFL